MAAAHCSYTSEIRLHPRGQLPASSQAMTHREVRHTRHSKSSSGVVQSLCKFVKGTSMQHGTNHSVASMHPTLHRHQGNCAQLENMSPTSNMLVCSTSKKSCGIKITRNTRQQSSTLPVCRRNMTSNDGIGTVHAPHCPRQQGHHHQDICFNGTHAMVQTHNIAHRQ